MSAYSFKHSVVGSCHTCFHRLYRHSTFAIPQPQLASRTQIRNKLNQQAKLQNKKLCLNIFIYFNVFYFPPWEKSAMQQMQANPKQWNTKQWRQQVPLPKNIQTSKRKKAKPSKERNYKKYLKKKTRVHHRQVLIIIQAYAEEVFWCIKLVISACKSVDIILYSDQHAATLLMASLSWIPHMFQCICQSVVIYCQYFWHIFFNFFFCNPAIMSHIVPQPAHFVVQLVFLQDEFNFKYILS